MVIRPRPCDNRGGLLNAPIRRFFANRLELRHCTFLWRDLVLSVLLDRGLRAAERAIAGGFGATGAGTNFEPLVYLLALIPRASTSLVEWPRTDDRRGEGKED